MREEAGVVNTSSAVRVLENVTYDNFADYGGTHMSVRDFEQMWRDASGGDTALGRFRRTASSRNLRRYTTLMPLG